MRKLLTGIIFAAALPASALASIADDLASGEASQSQIVANAVKGCGGDGGCEEAAIAEAVNAGIDVTTVINAAVDAGADSTKVVSIASKAATNAGQDAATVTAAVNASKAPASAKQAGLRTAGVSSTATPGQSIASSPVAKQDTQAPTGSTTTVYTTEDGDVFIPGTGDIQQSDGSISPAK